MSMKRFLSLWTLLLCFIGGAFAEEVTVSAATETELGAFITQAVNDNPGKDIVVKLDAGGHYTFTTNCPQLPVANAFTITSDASKPATITWASKPLRGGKSLIISNVIIDASANTGHIINMNEPTVDTWGEGAVSGTQTFWTIDLIKFDNVQVKSLGKALFLDQNKNNRFIVKSFEINNTIVELVNPGNVTINLQAAAVENFTITNSTVYNPATETSKGFLGMGGTRIWKAPGYEATAEAKITFENNTFYYNQTQTAQFFNTNAYKNQKQAKVIWKKNIFVGIPTNTFEKFMNSASTAEAMFTSEDNTYMNVDGTFWKDTKGWGIPAGIEVNPKFKDAANGDFALDLNSDQAKKKTGDPRWGSYAVLWSSETPFAIDWYPNIIQLSAEQTGVIEVGDVLHLSISDVPAGANQWNWKSQTRIEDCSWNDLGLGQALTEGQTEVTIVISGVVAKIIRERGLQIRGASYSANKLVLEKGVYSGSDNSVWVGKQALTWTQVNVGGALFQTAGAEVGKALEIYFERGEATPNVQLKTSWDAADQFYGGNYTGPSPLRIPLTEELANALKSKGLIINANDITVTSIEVNTYTDIATAAKKADKEEFVFNAEAIVVANVKKDNAAYVYIKDASGYGLIYDKDGSKTGALEVGKTIKPDWKGQVSIYNGLFEIVPQEELVVTDAAPVAEEDLYTKANSLKVFNNKDNVNRVYKIENVTLSEINKSNFTVIRGTLTAAGYNQFKKDIEEGLVCDVLASVGFYVDKEGKETTQFQPIKITTKLSTQNLKVSVSAGGDINDAIAKARKGKNMNPKTLTINLAKGSYTISKPIIAYGDVTINGKGANIDASGLTGPMIQMSKYPSVAGTAVGSVTAYQVGNVELNEINVDNLSQNLFDCNKTNYLFENVTLNKSIIAIKGASKKTIFNFNGGGNTKNLTVSGSTLYADDATTWQNGGFYSSQSGSSVDQLGGTEQKTTIENSTLYNICKGKTTSTRRKDSQKWMTYEVKNCIIVNSGKSGQFLAGLNNGQKGDNSNWIVDNSSFTYDGQDVAATEATKIKEGVMTNTVNGTPLFRKEITEGDFTLGICAQFYYKVGDPRWWDIPVPDELLAKLNKAAKLLSAAQADWQTAPAANEAIEKLAGAYNENAPYLNSYYQEEIDEATLRMEAAIAEFELVYGSDVTAIKSVDAVKADGTWYTINGQRISKPTEKGIYIHNGRKVVVK